jgi:hypothetical protein
MALDVGNIKLQPELIRIPDNLQPGRLPNQISLCGLGTRMTYQSCQSFHVMMEE